MACPTCDHTMQGLGLTTTGQRWFWCPRCGTLTEQAPGRRPVAERPRVVRRAEALLDLVFADAQALIDGRDVAPSGTTLRRLRDLAEAAGAPVPPVPPE